MMQPTIVRLVVALLSFQGVYAVPLNGDNVTSGFTISGVASGGANGNYVPTLKVVPMSGPPPPPQSGIVRVSGALTASVNGEYTVGSRVCNGRSTYQLIGGGASVIYSYGSSDIWYIAGSGALADCGRSGNFDIAKSGNGCPSYPYQGCVGTWKEKSGGDYRPNPNLKVDTGLLFRCVNNTCAPQPQGLPGGYSNATCQKGCGPVSSCLTALAPLCARARDQGSDPCRFCAGQHASELEQAGGTEADYELYCHAGDSTNSFTISGAQNTDPTLPQGTSLNGQYAITTRACNGKPTWQQVGTSGFGLYWCEKNGSNWEVGSSEALAKCGNGVVYYLGASGNCPTSPAGAGCVGKWQEIGADGVNHSNPELKVTMSQSRGM